LYDDNIFTLGPYVPVISYLNSNSNTIYTWYSPDFLKQNVTSNGLVHHDVSYFWKRHRLQTCDIS
jgi:hypothetical protein